MSETKSKCRPENGSNVNSADTIGLTPINYCTSVDISISPISSETAEFNDVIGQLCDAAYEDYRMNRIVGRYLK